MKRIRNSILSPFAWLIILMTVIILIVFNFTIRQSVEGLIRSELERSVDRAADMVDLRLEQSSTYSQSAEMYQIVIHDFMNISRQTANVEILILGNGGKVLFPETFDGSAITDEISVTAYEKSFSTDSIITFNVAGGTYLAQYKEFHIDQNHFIALLFVGVLSGALQIVTIVNITLIAVLIAVSIAAILISSRIASKISGPIAATADAASKISIGDFVMVSVDNSSREGHELTTSINKMSKHLQQYYELQTSAIQNASHELRTPLMSIQGYAEGIENDVFPDNKHAAKIIIAECKRLNRLVGELLTLSRIDNDAYYQNFSTIELVRIIQAAIEKVGGYAERHQKKVSFCSDTEFLHVKGSEELLMQSLLNVVYNGLRYADTKVEIRLEVENSVAVISVRDDGSGVAEKDFPYIFDRFYKGSGGNFGLGLSIAKSALDYMGGEISCRNDRGAIFTIHLPMEE